MAGSQLPNIFSFRRFANLSCPCGPGPSALGQVTCCRGSSRHPRGGKVQCLLLGHIREWSAIYQLITIRAETGEVIIMVMDTVKKLRGALRENRQSSIHRDLTWIPAENKLLL